jgi:stage V sporulation protein B
MGAVIWIFYKLIDIVLDLLGRNYISVLLSTIALVFIGAVVYAITLVYVKGIKKADLESMPVKLKRLIPHKLFKRIR